VNVNVGIPEIQRIPRWGDESASVPVELEGLEHLPRDAVAVDGALSIDVEKRGSVYLVVELHGHSCPERAAVGAHVNEGLRRSRPAHRCSWEADPKSRRRARRIFGVSSLSAVAAPH
jgi:hypothetical protein